MSLPGDISRREALRWLGRTASGGALAAWGAIPLQAATPGRFRLGMASCIDQNKEQPIWDEVLRHSPDLMLFGGDNVYGSDQPFSIETLRRAYAMQAGQPGFAQLRSQISHMAIWDDHDYGLNDGGADFAHKAASKAAFLDFWQVPADDERRRHEGLYHARVWGEQGRQVQVIMLDGRWFRSPLKATDQRNAPGKERYLPDEDPAKTLLGPSQWTWLEAQMRVAAQVRVVVSGIQVLAMGHGWECWNNFPLELDRLRRTLSQSAGRAPVVLLSGDRHIGAIYRDVERPGLVEMTSSGITHAWADAREAGPNRVGDLVTQLHFGLVDILWNEARIELQLLGLQGQRLHGLHIPLAPTI